MSVINGDNQSTTPQIGVATITREEAPVLWNVIFINDDITTYDCVITILRQIFDMDYDRARAFATLVDSIGFGIVGCYPKEEATKKQQAGLSIAHSKGYPLEIRIEPQN